MGNEFDFLAQAIKGNEHNETKVEDAEVVPEEKVFHTLQSGEKVEVINGRYKDPTTGKWKFAPGNQIAKVNKGTLRPKVPSEFGEKLSVSDWEKLTIYVETKGIEAFIQEMGTLQGRDFIVAYLGILPFVKPKIASVEVKDPKGKKTKLDKNHTITIRDMRDGSEVTVGGGSEK